MLNRTADALLNPGAPKLDDTLAERGGRYGAFENHARVAMTFKDQLRLELARLNKVLASDQMQALDTIFDKIARVVNGDPNYPDNWHDIAGYATLVERRLVALATPTIGQGTKP
jgi:hypothetical protein